MILERANDPIIEEEDEEVKDESGINFYDS